MTDPLGVSAHSTGPLLRLCAKVRYSRRVVAVNEAVQVSQAYDGTTLTGGTRAVVPNTQYVVTRIARNKVMIRRNRVSVWVPLNILVGTDGKSAVGTPVKKRAMGEAPEGDHIAVNDPRIAWIWEDAAKVADVAGYCSTYDDLADRIGAPGRVRDFNVTITLHDMTGIFTVDAKSKPEAAAKIMEKFPEAKVISNQDTGRRRR